MLILEVGVLIALSPLHISATILYGSFLTEVGTYRPISLCDSKVLKAFCKSHVYMSNLNSSKIEKFNYVKVSVVCKVNVTSRSK